MKIDVTKVYRIFSIKRRGRLFITRSRRRSVYSNPAFYGNSFAEMVCTPFCRLIVIGKTLLDFLAKTLCEEPPFCRENADELHK